jgi:anaerobic selenocysteine-containing dehydrogenase
MKMPKFSRREFFKAGAVAAGGTLVSSAFNRGNLMFGQPLPQKDLDQEINSCCQFCQVRCTTKVQVKDCRVVNVYGNPDNFWTNGAMCPKGKSMVELTYSPHRILHPMIREGDKWERISYSTALDLVAQKILNIKEQFSEDYSHRLALFAPLWESRESEIAAKMALHLAGFPDICSPGDACIGNASSALQLCLGMGLSPTSLAEILNAELVVLFGANIAEMYPPYMRWLSRAGEKGVKIIYIDPRRTPTSNFCDRQLMPRPGTDGALVLGIINLLIKENRYDKAYVEAHVNGFKELAESSAPFTPEKVSEITWIPSYEVVELARIMAQSRKNLVWIGGSISRYTNAINTIRAIIALQAITNNLIGSGRGLMSVQGGKPGGGDPFFEHFKQEGLSSRLSFRKVLFNMERKRVNLLLLNSSFRRYPDSNRIKRAINNVDFVVYRGFFMDEETKISHLIIPATMTFESEGSQYGTQRQVVWRNRAIPRRGETVEDWRFYSDLGKKINQNRFPNVSSAEDIYELFRKWAPSWKGLSLERLKRSPSGIIWPYPDPEAKEQGALYANNRFHTTDGKVELRTKALGPISWEAPKGSPESNNEKGEKFPLIFTQGKVVQHWQHTYTNWSRLMGQFSHGNYVLAHPETVEELKLKDDEEVFIETEIGRLKARLHLTETILPGVIWTPSHLSPAGEIKGNSGESINSIVPFYWDKVAAQFNGFGCTLVKA